VNEHRPYLIGTPGGAATVANLDQHLADESAAIADQESNASDERAAAGLLRKGRRALQDAVKHIAAVSAVVMPIDGKGTPFDPTHPPNDDQLIGRVEFLHGEVAANLDAYTKGGIQPGRVETLAGELAAFKKLKATLRSRVHAEAADRFDQAFEQANQDFAILEGILATSPDAPAGALEALRATTRIGPRIPPEDPTAETTDPATPTTPGTPGTTTSTTHTPAPAPVPDKAA
jgi:hypothetical protein